MRAALIALSTIALAPSAFAQTTCDQRSNQVVGTIAGGAVGALLGSAIAGHGHKDDGALVGALGGAVVGNQLSKPNSNNCAQAYGFYDNQGMWHATGVDRARASGYYDRQGRWVSGEPNGYYDQSGVWVTADARVGDGYYDNRGRWVPPSVNGYYDQDNRWIAVAADRRDDWTNRTIRERSDMLRQRIIRAEADGRISHREARSFLDELRSINMQEARLPHRRGELNYNDRVMIEAPLDALRSDLRREMRG